MTNWLYTLYALVIGIISIFTGEVVTFVMLGFILLALQNINRTLRRLIQVNKEKTYQTDQ